MDGGERSIHSPLFRVAWEMEHIFGTHYYSNKKEKINKILCRIVIVYNHVKNQNTLIIFFFLQIINVI